MKIPERANSIAALIDKYHEEASEPPRSHMGCSTLGHHCDRWLWLSFRWAVVPVFPGRILRLFRRGHREEKTVVSDLRAIGMDVQNTGESQSRVSFGCHVSGSVDGIIRSGVPEAPKKPHVLEIKTHSKKSFDALEKEGVENAKPEHFVQMQVYMKGTETDRALYVAVCKDDDRLYTERVRYDAAVADRAVARGQRIAITERMPEPASADPSWYKCKFCDAHDFCFSSKTTRHVNCRTCAHVTPKDDGTWRCERHQADGIPLGFQRSGCDSHVLHPDLVPWQMGEPVDDWTASYVIDGKSVGNGEPRRGVFTSRELLANAHACANADEPMEVLREAFNGRIE